VKGEERTDQILDLAARQGYVSIEGLARHFAVTPQTIRRDINRLCADGLLERHHGGAVVRSSTHNVDYLARKSIGSSAKEAIGRLVARHVPNGASLFINIGTTTEAVAKALTGHERLSVITNNLNVAAFLTSTTDFEVIVAGGLVRNRDGGIVGEATIDFINQFKVDYGIIGISGIDTDGTLLDFDYREVRVAQAIVRNARTVFLAADHSKFGRSALVRLGHIGEVAALFTDQPPPPPLSDVLAANDVAIHVAR
jgi:DeoR family transcriptional regulator, glycerol-3-phosphate regulon repressor